MNDDPQISLKMVSTIQDKQRFSDARFSSDGLSIITRRGTEFKRWSVETGAPLQSSGPADPDAVAFADTAAQQIDGDPLPERASRAAQEHFSGWSDLVTLSPNGSYVVVGSSAGCLGAVDLAQNMALILDGHTTSMNNHMHQNSITSLLFDPSSRYLISMAEEDDAPLLWDLSARGAVSTRNAKQAVLLAPSIRLNDVTPGGIDTIHFSPVAPSFVTTHRVAETAQVWRIVRT